MEVENSKYCFVDVNHKIANHEKFKELLDYLNNKKMGEGANEKHIDSYVLTKPIGENYSYEYDMVCVMLIPKYQLIFLNIGSDKEQFENYMLDFQDDIGKVSSKYKYEEQMGRLRTWFKKGKIYDSENISQIENFDSFIKEHQLTNEVDIKRIELLISLLTNSINDIERVNGIQITDNTLDKIKQKIILFDKDQLDVITNDKNLMLQGLSGTGKTEILLHKVKYLYSNIAESKIALTCFNKVLANNLRQRIPSFFDFMKVDEQIKWDERLWVFSSWGSGKDKNSGLYAYICNFYDITFKKLKESKKSFSNICKEALNTLIKKYGENIRPAFDYILIDESQDFDSAFFELCKKVSKQIYVAGDIFQNIYNKEFIDNQEFGEIKYLNRCYRTDPKTLMFGHAVGMGLFEEQKINWLEARQWEYCGYEVESNESKYILKREPLRRFEDIVEIENVVFEDCNENNIIDKVISILATIKQQNITVKAEDIAIVYPNKQFEETRIFCRNLEKRANSWEFNFVLDTKSKREREIFFANENNIKGLEFPFIILILNQEIKNSLQFRNILYMIITRSMMQTYLLMTDNEKMQVFQKGFENIKKNGYMIVSEPSDENKKQIKDDIDRYNKKLKMPKADIWDSIFNDLKIGTQARKQIQKSAKGLDFDTDNEDQIRDFIEKQLTFIKDRTR